MKSSQDVLQLCSENTQVTCKEAQKSLYIDKLNSFLNADSKETTDYTNYYKNPNIENYTNMIENQKKINILGESISKRRMKLKGLACPTESNQRVCNEYHKYAKKHSTPSSVFNDDPVFNFMITNPSDRNSVINKNPQYDQLYATSANRILVQKKRDEDFLSILGTSLDYLSNKKHNVNFEKDSLDDEKSFNNKNNNLMYNDKTSPFANSGQDFNIDRILSTDIINQDFKQVKNNNYAGFETVNTTNGLIMDTSNSKLDQKHLNIANQQSCLLIQENKELKSLCNIYQTKNERMKLAYKKLKNKYNLQKEVNSGLLMKIDKERSSNLDSKGFIKNFLDIKTKSLDKSDMENPLLKSNNIYKNNTSAISRHDLSKRISSTTKPNYYAGTSTANASPHLMKQTNDVLNVIDTKNAAVMKDEISKKSL